VPGTIYTFGPFRLEAGERRLLRDGDLVSLSGKAFDTLVLLVEGAGSLQTQQSLIDRLWPDTVVEPNNLQYNVSLIRRALGNVDDVEIQTVRGQGYRLVADVTRATASAEAAPATPGTAAAVTTSTVQRTYFCRARDGARLAYATLGVGPPIVKVANWLNHLELDWEGPIWRHWLELLSRERRLTRYDARGNGLSDWEAPSITFADFVDDLGAVLNAADIERAPIVGISQGAAVAAAYAARHPERVSALILVGGCARGWRVKGQPRLTERFEALMVLMRQGWGGQNAAFRQIFTTAFVPHATQEQADWFNELQRKTTSPENAVRILSALGDVDVRTDLPQVNAPTLVLHSRGDAVIPMKDGIELASGIRGARFVPLDSDSHLLLAGEPAWQRFAGELESFLAECAALPPS
jgi:pimeloyl-ACP methyl ester carboxylesterase/DNA-binding winged helix-turn-helix (wHTH) protein